MQEDNEEYVNHLIDLWHQGKGSASSLQDSLRMTSEEFAKFVTYGIIPEDIQKR